MTGGIIAGVVTPHTPRMAVEAKAPDFLRGVIAGSYALGAALRANGGVQMLALLLTDMSHPELQAQALVALTEGDLMQKFA